MIKKGDKLIREHEFKYELYTVVRVGKRSVTALIDRSDSDYSCTLYKDSLYRYGSNSEYFRSGNLGFKKLSDVTLSMIKNNILHRYLKKFRKEVISIPVEILAENKDCFIQLINQRCEIMEENNHDTK